MDAKDYHEIIKKLVGPIEPIGETNEDDRRYENLKTMITLVDSLLFDIDMVSIESDRIEYSMKRAGEKAKKFMEDIKEA